MDTAARMRADARRNRERLLAAALTAFTERGSDDTSLEEIARRAGVGIGTLYRHFPTRQALLAAVYRDQVDALCAAARLPQASPGAALTAFLRDLTQFGLTKRSLTGELLAGPEGTEVAVFSACRAEITETAARLLSQAQDAGEARPGLEPSDLLRLSHAIVVASEKAADRAGEAGRLLGILLGGVLTPPATAPPQGAPPQTAPPQTAGGRFS